MAVSRARKTVPAMTLLQRKMMAAGANGLEDRVEHQEVGGGVEQGLSVICFYPLQVGHVVLRVVTAH